MKYFGTSGIRRLADADLIRIAQNVGFALGRKYKKIIIATDTRTSNEAIKFAMISSLLAMGVNVSDAGVVPTPTVAKAGKNYDCAVMITASHNPPEYNGIKILNPDGSPFSAEQQSEIEEFLDNNELPIFDYKNCGKLTSYNTAVEEHIKIIRDLVPGSFNNLKVVLDPNCGAGTSITEKLLRDMGVQLTVINGEANGIFPRPAEPMPENLTMLCNKVKEIGADLGIAHDGDADRVMIVDDKGRAIPGENILIMFGEYAKVNSLVTTVDASMAVEESKFKVLRSAVGDNNVTDLMIEQNIPFGGEPSGSWIFKEMSYCPDGIYGAAIFCKIASLRKLSEYSDSINQYPMLRESLKTIIDYDKAEIAFKNIFPDAELNKIDGLRYGLQDGWVLIRKSGTEPKVRFTVEAKTADRAKEICETAMNAVKGL